VTEPNVAALLSRINIRVADDLTNAYPAQWPARLSIATRDGSEERGASNYPRGNPENAVSTDTLEAKFTELVAPRYGDSFTTRALSLVRSLDDCADVRAAFEALT